MKGRLQTVLWCFFCYCQVVPSRIAGDIAARDGAALSQDLGVSCNADIRLGGVKSAAPGLSNLTNTENVGGSIGAQGAVHNISWINCVSWVSVLAARDGSI